MKFEELGSAFSHNLFKLVPNDCDASASLRKSWSGEAGDQLVEFRSAVVDSEDVFI